MAMSQLDVERLFLKRATT